MCYAQLLACELQWLHSSTEAGQSKGIQLCLLLPWPGLQGNFAARTNTCLMGEQFSAAVKGHEGFAFVDEGKPGKPKTGWVATQPGSWLEFEVNTKQVGQLWAAGTGWAGSGAWAM